MLWVIGCDEAGYGPPLGAFTQGSVALFLPGSTGAIEDSWAAYPELFRKRRGAARARPGVLPLVVDDSKVMTQLASGMDHLGALWPVLFGYPYKQKNTLKDLLDWAHLPDHTTFRDDPTLVENFPISWVLEDGLLENARSALHKNGLTDCRARISMVSPAVFNQMIDHHQNKSAVLEKGWQSHIHWWLHQLPGDEPIVILSDRLGGKKCYAGIFQEALGAKGLVQVIREDDNQCTYRCLGTDREIMLIVSPKADSKYLPVAAASMLAKHLRELSMEMVNRYWMERVPNLKPTAGYPEDGKRFYAEIQSTMARSGVNPDHVWRKR